MWMNLVQISPFSNGLLTQKRFKVTCVDFGTAHDSRDVHISPGYFMRSNKISNVQLPFLCASLESATLILLSKALLVVKKLF